MCTYMIYLPGPPLGGVPEAGRHEGLPQVLGPVRLDRVHLVADDPHKIMIALGYPTMAEAADAIKQEDTNAEG